MNEFMNKDALDYTDAAEKMPPVDCTDKEEKMPTDDCKDKAEALSSAKDGGCAYGTMKEDKKVNKDPKAACRIDFFQKERVSVPVKVTPFATPCEAKVTCCGKPYVVSGSDRTDNCDHCIFKVTQALCIEIPISFGAKVETGDAEVQCGIAGTDKCDCE